MDITIEKTTQYLYQLDVLARTAYPNDLSGFSVNSAGLIAHLLNEPAQPMLDDILLMMQEHNILTVSATKAQVVADGVDETVITCLELPTDISYTLYKGVEVMSVGSFNDGSIELSFNEDATGNYVVEVRDPASYATGYIDLEVVSG